MKELGVYQLKNIKQCPFKAFVSSFKDFKTSINKSKMITDTYKKIIKENWLLTDEETLNELINNELDDSYFITMDEKNDEINTMKKYITRYFNYENRKPIAVDVYGKVKTDDNLINVKADLVFDNGVNIELVKFKTSENKLSYKARTEANLPQNDIELFLLQKLGEQVYQGKKIKSSYYHFKGKNQDSTLLKSWLQDTSSLNEKLYNLEDSLMTTTDKKQITAIKKDVKKINDILYFNNTDGDNIISREIGNDLTETIEKLLSNDLSFNSEKCSSSDCEFCSYSTLCKQSEGKNIIELKEIPMIKKSSGELKLTEAQKQVVGIEEGIHRINAVAGSGKSTTMVMRTIELIKKGYSPEDILLITFTNKGCEELKEKIMYWIEYYNIKNIRIEDLNIYTFNSFGDGLIKKEWSKLGFSKSPDLATMIDINDIIKEMLEDREKINWLNYKNPLLNYPNAKGVFKQLKIYFDYIKSYGLEDFRFKFTKDNLSLAENELTNRINLIKELYWDYETRLKNKQLLEYQDQVLLSIELLEKNKELVSKYGYEHLVIDEFQDTDKTQVQLIKLLMEYKDFKSLIVVGDDVQAIYSFRNTTPENIINFHKEFKNVEDIFLVENFRSTPEICDLANELSKLNTKRIDKDIVSKKDSGNKPMLEEYNTLNLEYEGIANKIKELINNGIKRNEISFIARTKKELLEFQEELNKLNIPSIIEVSELYIDNLNVQAILNLSNFFKNNDYDYYLLEYLFAIDENIKRYSKKEINEVISTLKEQIITSLESIESEEDKIKYFYRLLDLVICKDKIAYRFVEQLKNRTFYTFNELLTYLRKVVLYQDNTSIEKEEVKYDAVVLTTAHSSKGKEWSVVINSVNKYRYEEIKPDLDLFEEERRLLFVSITRAKDCLYITYNTQQDKTRNKGKYTGFVNEIKEILED